MIQEKGIFSSLIVPEQCDRPLEWEQVFGRSAPLHVEIGFGLGEYLLQLLQEQPQINYVGFEQNWERLYKTLYKVQALGLSGGVRIMKADAGVAFERLFKPRSVQRVYCLFPCPWLKDRHIKHRLFSKRFLRLLNNRLEDNGEVRIITDSKPYFDWVLEQSGTTGYRVSRGFAAGRVNTKFERKWIEGGQNEFYELNMVKALHQAFPVRIKRDMKSYKIRAFDPETFKFKDEKKKISVIFKGLLFDPEKAKAMVHLVVAEDTLTQHVWVDIKKEEKFWRICKTDGQNIYPTPGVMRALELVHQAASKS